MTEENTTIETQNETPQLTAGEMLRNARTMGRRKREIQTIAKQLCIREEFLEALEAGNYTAIPEVVYILGFARNYAMELGLNPDEIVAQIKRELGLDPEIAASASDEERYGDARGKSGLKFLKNGWFETVRNFTVRNWKWMGAALGGLIVIIVAAVLLFGGGSATTDVDVAADAPIIATDTVVEPEFRVKVRKRIDPQNAKTGNIAIQVTADNEAGSWVRIVDARGNSVYSGVLFKGDVYFVPAGNKYKGTFANAGGIDIWVDGELAPAIGTGRERVEGISLSPESLMKKKTEKAE